MAKWRGRLSGEAALVRCAAELQSRGLVRRLERQRMAENIADQKSGLMISFATKAQPTLKNPESRAFYEAAIQQLLYEGRTPGGAPVYNVARHIEKPEGRAYADIHV
jgi:hypothetical protein